MSDQSNRGKSPQEVVNNAIKQFEGLKKAIQSSALAGITLTR